MPAVEAKIIFNPNDDVKKANATALRIAFKNIGYKPVLIENPRVRGILVEVCGEIIEENDLYGWLKIFNTEYARKGCGQQ